MLNAFQHRKKYQPTTAVIPTERKRRDLARLVQPAFFPFDSAPFHSE